VTIQCCLSIIKNVISEKWSGKMKICTLMSGSSGNAIYIESGKNKILIDAGQSGKALAQALDETCGISPDMLDAVLITHAHRDHVAGAGVMSRRYKLPLYATEGTWQEMEPLVGNIAPERKRFIESGDSLEIGDIKVETFPTSHDALEPVGYICTSGRKSAGVATDSGVFTSRMARMLVNLDCLVLEANHDPELLINGKYPWPLKRRISSVLGHLSNQDAGQALLKTLGERTRKVILAHLSEENNRPGLALDSVEEVLRIHKVELEDVDIAVAPRYNPGPVVRI
jgi:phosphoribosyl 1,2-cyclic phosphodiesterase